MLDIDHTSLKLACLRRHADSTNHERRSDGELVAKSYLLETDLAGFVVGDVLISHTPAHVDHLKIQAQRLAVTPQAGEDVSHQLVTFLQEIYKHEERERLISFYQYCFSGTRSR